MKAVRFHSHGGADVLVYEEAPDPAPAPDKVIVRVRACALNHLDLWQRRGLDRVRIPLPHISGSDVSGEIVSGGTLAPGTRVMVHPGLFCGTCARCVEGRDNECPFFSVLGYMSDGGYAELVSVPAGNVIPIPDHVDFVAAAAFPLTFLTAWHMLITKARLRPGEVVLVLAGGSGVGQAAIQVAKLHGATVLATSAPEKFDQARALGADEVFDHYTGDFSQGVRGATRGRGADVVIEHVGEATWDRSVRALARSGRLVICGATTGPRATLNLQHLFAKQLAILGSYMGRRSELLAAAPLFFEGKLTPAVDEVLPLSEARTAHERLEAGRQFGKIVLTP